MRRRQLLLLALLLCFFVAGSLLYVGRDRLRGLPHLVLRPQDHEEKPQDPVKDATGTLALEGRLGSILQIRTYTDCSARTVPILSEATISTYLDAILDRKSTRLSNLNCPTINDTRYESLRPTDLPDSSIRYFFALNLRQNLPLLPRLIGSIVEVIRFLGPQYCAISIVEGHSSDGTKEVLEALRADFEALGIAYSLQSSLIDPSTGDRIGRLAELRNLALQPLHNASSRANKDTSILFVNDVAACPDDLLELALQRRNLGADMTCAMDWSHIARDPTFYDVWIARGINGDSFFEIPEDGSWKAATKLFWNADESRARFYKNRPFQVFACWNGAVALGARPFLEDLRFRAPNETAGECFQGEPQLLCKDMWFRGCGKIAVVPTVNLEYSVSHGKIIKAAKGFASYLAAHQNLSDDRIEWQPPPDKVKCMRNWHEQKWVPWNETLT